MGIGDQRLVEVTDGTKTTLPSCLERKEDPFTLIVYVCRIIEGLRRKFLRRETKSTQLKSDTVEERVTELISKGIDKLKQNTIKNKL